MAQTTAPTSVRGLIAEQPHPVAWIARRETDTGLANLHAAAEESVVTDVLDGRVATALVSLLSEQITKQTFRGTWVACGLADAALTRFLAGTEQPVLEARRAVVSDIVETVSRTVARVGRIALRVERIAAGHSVTQEKHRALAALTAIVRAIVAVRRARRQISDVRMAAIPGAVALIVRTLVAVIRTGGVRGLDIRQTQSASIACIRTIASCIRGIAARRARVTIAPLIAIEGVIAKFAFVLRA